MRTNSRTKFSTVIIGLMDLMIINLGFYFAFNIRIYFSGIESSIYSYTQLLPWISGLSFVTFYMFDLYTNWQRKSYHNLVYSIMLSLLFVLIFSMALTYFYPSFIFARSVVFISFLLQLAGIVMARSLIWSVSKKLYGSKDILIIAEDLNSGLKLANKFLKHTNGWFNVKGFLPIADRKNMKDKLAEIDAILISPNLKESDKGEIISYCSYYGIEVILVPELFELFLLDAEPQQIDDMLVLSIRPPMLSAGQRFVKRTFDLIVSLLILIVTSPIMLLLTILIPLTSKGPAIFKQERVGRNGTSYNVYKFRSMINDAEKQTGPVLATDKDPRITPIGHFIRATRLDELPQIINVLKGEMSLVGPRPERDYFIRKFEEDMPNYKYRMTVKPGITGLAQVMAKYSTTVEDKLRFDLMYIRNYSFALDIKILLQTIRVVLQLEQAKGVEEDDTSRDELIQLFGFNEIASTKK
ncbi:sugar transferase [Bacillus sp. Marseille-P3661]|uniref:sugar transferase n=1 Tax=Bacillus sp. Marseille-P3661 TaxID=1936234 RepID=UPI000C85A3CF|nr:sugar transferase [Bacillus sp. Marseille-P3661]